MVEGTSLYPLQIAGDINFSSFPEDVNSTKLAASDSFYVQVTSTDCDIDRLLTSLPTVPRIAVVPSNCDVIETSLGDAVLHTNPGSRLSFLALQAVLDHEPISMADLIVIFYDNSVGKN